MFFFFLLFQSSFPSVRRFDCSHWLRLRFLSHVVAACAVPFFSFCEENTWPHLAVANDQRSPISTMQTNHLISLLVQAPRVIYLRFIPICSVFALTSRHRRASRHFHWPIALAIRPGNTSGTSTPPFVFFGKYQSRKRFALWTRIANLEQPHTKHLLLFGSFFFCLSLSLASVVFARACSVWWFCGIGRCGRHFQMTLCLYFVRVYANVCVRAIRALLSGRISFVPLSRRHRDELAVFIKKMKNNWSRERLF